MVRVSKLATKTDLLTEIRTQRRHLENNLAGLTPAEMCQPGVCGDWSVKDVLAHLTAWEQNTCNHYLWAKTIIRSWKTAA
jgi:hypothetical protein